MHRKKREIYFAPDSETLSAELKARYTFATALRSGDREAQGPARRRLVRILRAENKALEEFLRENQEEIDLYTKPREGGSDEQQ